MPLSKPICIVGIDPSNLCVGVGAVMVTSTGRVTPVGAACIKQEYNDWVCGASTIGHQVQDMVCQLAPDSSHYGDNETIIFLEVPDNWFDKRGENSKNNEAVQKLYAATGSILSSLQWVKVATTTCYGVRPIQWKGTVPKEVSRTRLNRWLEQYGYKPLDKDVPNDVSDALSLAKRGAEEVFQQESKGSSSLEKWSLIWQKGQLMDVKITTRIIDLL